MLEKFSLDSDKTQKKSHNWQSDSWDEIQINSAKEVRNNISGLTENILKNEGYQRGQFLNRWQEILGEGVAQNTYPTYIKNETLFVVCSSPIWSQEITLQQRTILQRFNAFMPKNKKLKRIICKVGNIRSQYRNIKKSRQYPSVDLGADELQKIENIANQIEDPELKQKLIKAYSQNLIYNRQLKAIGTKECSRCHNASFSGDPCFQCRRLEQENIRTKVLHQLNNQPWTKYSEIKLYLPNLELGDFMVYRLSLASNWRESIRRQINSLKKDTPLSPELQVQMIKLVSLEMSKPYAKISSRDVICALRPKYGNALLNKRAPGPPVGTDKNNIS